jgi:hypothetical protein
MANIVATSLTLMTSSKASSAHSTASHSLTRTGRAISQMPAAAVRPIASTILVITILLNSCASLSYWKKTTTTRRCSRDLCGCSGSGG